MVLARRSHNKRTFYSERFRCTWNNGYLKQSPERSGLRECAEILALCFACTYGHSVLAYVGRINAQGEWFLDVAGFFPHPCASRELFAPARVLCDKQAAGDLMARSGKHGAVRR